MTNDEATNDEGGLKEEWGKSGVGDEIEVEKK
jgi:hypothetical protein